MHWQRTLKRTVELAGVGLHSGMSVRVRVQPAPADTGVVFRVLRRSATATVRAHIAHVDDRKSQLCTQLTCATGEDDASTVSVSTVEHLMAALTAASISNALVDVDALDANASHQSVELPILDGSSLNFVDALYDAGIASFRGAPQRYIRIERPVQVLMDDKAAWLLPIPQRLGATPVRSPTLELSVQVNFAHKGLGTTFQRFTLDGADPDATLAAFRSELAPARTFTFEDEIAWMRSHGLALGGSLDNAIVFTTSRDANSSASDDTESARAPGVETPSPSARVLNPRGLRFPDDEWTRHKLLDCIGDVGLAGLPLHGYFFATSPGHALTHKLLRALFSDSANYSEVTVES